MMSLLFDFEIGLARWPHLKVLWLVVLTFPDSERALPGHPQWLRRQLQRTGRPEIHVTSRQPLPGQTKQVDVSPPPSLLSFMLHFCFFFFFSSSNCSEFSPWPSFICGKMLSGRACWDFVWACIPEEGQQSVCTPRMEKMVPCSRSYWTHSFQNESIPSIRDSFQ